MFHKPKQMETPGPSHSLSRNMTSPHMVPVIDQSLESDDRGGGEQGERRLSALTFSTGELQRVSLVLSAVARLC